MSRSLLLYGSNTGNTQYVAEVIEQTFQSHGASLTINNVIQAKPEDVLGRDILILGASTWESMASGKTKPGQLQDQMAAFLSKIKPLKLSKTSIAVFGLGDSRYQYFCGAAVLLKKFVSEMGAPLLTDPLYVDGNPQYQLDSIVDWSNEVIQAHRSVVKR